MKKLFRGTIFMLLTIVALPNSLGQTIGIGTDFPTATLDIITTADMPSVRIDRSLTPAAATSAALEINDNSDYGAMEIFSTNPTSFGPVHYVENDGLGNGYFINMTNTASAAYAQVIINNSNSQGGIIIDNAATSAIGIDLFLENGAGVRAFHSTRAPLPFGSFYTDQSAFPNLTGAGANVAYVANLDGSDGLGYYFYNNDNLNGGNGFGYFGFIETLTPASGGIAFGTLFGGEQNGVGHGLLINHDGTEGRNAEFNVEDRDNPDHALFVTHSGDEGAMFVQNQKSNMGGQIIVADISYAGSDNDHHIAVYGSSAPSATRGDGVVGEGGRYGVRSEGDMQINNGDLNITGGTKNFYIDHPLDPKNKILKHFAIESNQVLNVYQGMARLDRRGMAEVQLPDYFEAININYTYQLTAIGTPVQPYIDKKIEGGVFAISGRPGSEVSWMVIANRNDAYMQTHPEALITELDKRPEEIGKYFDPISHGQPKTMGIFYRELKTGVPSKFEELNVVSPNTREEIYDERGAKNRIDEIRPSNSEGSRRMPISPLEIRQEIKTWDEIH